MGEQREMITRFLLWDTPVPDAWARLRFPGLSCETSILDEID